MTSNTAAAAIAGTGAEAGYGGELRPGWGKEEILGLFSLPFNDLLHRSHEIHRRNWDVNEIQLSTLVSVKTGGCAENCGYCGQSAHHEAKIEATKMMPLEEVMAAARKAKEAGATRLCMGAAWRSLRDRDLPHLMDIISGVKGEGMETCVTLGMLTTEQAQKLKESGLDYYNHNVDTSEEYYGEIVTTHTFQDRLDTLGNVRAAGLKVCSGGIVGMGEDRADRAGMLATLANLNPPPESVPVNMLVPIPGTPLADRPAVDPLELVRTIAVARILMPRSRVRLSAGREAMSDAIQALCFFAGANSMFYGERLLTANNPVEDKDRALFERLGLHAEIVQELRARPVGVAAAG
ncbi:MAG: biotin synthase BioB [Alphaproteobacteria bacterium]|nr:biotin synthase BioB [Alphaproteobacteria bacterium]